MDERASAGGADRLACGAIIMNAPPFGTSGAALKPAAADTRTVTDLLDSTAGSSRQAIIAAKNNAVLDTRKKEIRDLAMRTRRGIRYSCSTNQPEVPNE